MEVNYVLNMVQHVHMNAAVCDQMDILQYIFHHNKQNVSENLRWTVRDEHGNTPLHLGKLKNIKNNLI